LPHWQAAGEALIMAAESRNDTLATRVPTVLHKGNFIQEFGVMLRARRSPENGGD